MLAAALAALVLSTVGQQTAPAPAPTPAPAGVPTPAAAPAAAAPAAPQAEQICRRQPIEGSRRYERVCHTRAEWDLLRANARTNHDTASRNQRDRS